MPVPRYGRFVEPLLRLLVANPEGLRAREAHEKLADQFQLTAED
jgi:restriction endonuclease Mrr